VLQGGAADGGNFEMTAYQGAAKLGGTNVSFDDAKIAAAGKPIVLNFWGGTCPPCRAEMPGFQRAYERNQDDFLMIGLDVGPFFGLGTRNSALSLLEELGITYPAAFATSREPITQFGAVALPSTFFFDGNGNLVASRIGFMDEAEFEGRLRSLIGEPAAGTAPGDDGDA
jgi:thiol-disulfide isomerase/thioredoxin